MIRLNHTDRTWRAVCRRCGREISRGPTWQDTADRAAAAGAVFYGASAYCSAACRQTDRAVTVTIGEREGLRPSQSPGDKHG